LGEAPVLVSPDYSKYFIIFFFAYENIIAAILLQKNDENHEKPIAFFRKNLRDSKLKYNNLEKYTYALVKYLKYLRAYNLQYKIIAYVPSSIVKEIMTKPGSDGRRGKWIEKIQEYDLEIKPKNLIKSQGLDKLLA
jgi:hypothetical protein